jgi:hypothetical protein
MVTTDEACIHYADHPNSERSKQNPASCMHLFEAAVVQSKEREPSTTNSAS